MKQTESPIPVKLATIVVTYNPETQDVIGNIHSYSDLTDVLIVWDNTEREENDWHDLTTFRPDAIVIQKGKNVGLAKAYNEGIAIAKAHGCTHLMTMDQDSTFICFERYFPQITENDILGVAVNRDDYQTLERHEAGYLCQSGTTFPMSMFDHIGGFREDFFIGMVDVEMDIRAAKNGYRLFEAAGCTMQHRVGSGRTAKVLGHLIHVSDYNPLRLYYDSRNRILMWHEFPDDCDRRFKRRFLFGRIKLMVKILLLEKDKYSKVRAILRGTCYGLLDKTKPYKKNTAA